MVLKGCGVSVPGRLCVLSACGGSFRFCCETAMPEDLKMRRGGKRMRVESKASLTLVQGGPKRQWTSKKARETEGSAASFKRGYPPVHRSAGAPPTLDGFTRVGNTLPRPSLSACAHLLCFRLFRVSAEDSILKQCYAQGSRVLLLSWLGAGWSFFPIVLSKDKEKFNRDQRKALNTQCFKRDPKDLPTIFNREILRPSELDAALLEAFEEVASSESGDESDSESVQSD